MFIYTGLPQNTFAKSRKQAYDWYALMRSNEDMAMFASRGLWINDKYDFSNCIIYGQQNVW